MLENGHNQQLARLLQRLPLKVNAPESSTGYYDKFGVLPSYADDNRRYARKYLRSEAVCELLSTLPAIARKHSYYRVILQDVSRAGIGFLHHQQLYPNENVVLWTNAGKLRAVVRRCIKQCEDRYEVGAEFD